MAIAIKNMILLILGGTSSATGSISNITFSGLFLLEDNSSHILLENGTDRLKGEG